jgi:hypothetical protein
MSEETVTKPQWERQRWWGLWALHLPPAGYIIGASLLGGVLGAWFIRHSSGLVDITLRLGLVIRLLGVLAFVVAFSSGWRASGPWWVRWPCRLVMLSSFGVMSVLSVLGERASPWMVDVAVGLFFAALPLYLRRARLTEPWMSGSLMPALLASLTAFSFIPALGFLTVYQYVCTLRAQSTLEDIQALTAGISQLAERGSLSEDEVKSMQGLARGLPGAASLWVSLAVMPPKESRRRQGDIEEAVSGLLTATQNLFMSAPSFVSAAKMSGLLSDKNNQERFAKVRLYWEQVRQITGDGQLLEPFLSDQGAPFGLAPNSKLKPQADDVVGRVSLFRADIKSQLEGLQGAFSSFDTELSRFAEASAALSMLRSYPNFSVALPLTSSVILDPFEVDAWGRLRFNGIELFNFWELLTIPESRIAEDGRCVKDKFPENKKVITAYSCTAFNVSKSELPSAFMARIIFRYQVDQSATPKEITFESQKPNDIVTWKKSLRDTLKQRSVIVKERKPLGGFELSPPESSANQDTLILQFDDRKEVARFKVERITPVIK